MLSTNHKKDHIVEVWALQVILWNYYVCKKLPFINTFSDIANLIGR